jgi:hypothetical protein
MKRVDAVKQAEPSEIVGAKPGTEAPPVDEEEEERGNAPIDEPLIQRGDAEERRF